MPRLRLGLAPLGAGADRPRSPRESGAVSPALGAFGAGPLGPRVRLSAHPLEQAVLARDGAARCRRLRRTAPAARCRSIRAELPAAAQAGRSLRSDDVVIARRGRTTAMTAMLGTTGTCQIGLRRLRGVVYVNVCGRFDDRAMTALMQVATPLLTG